MFIRAKASHYAVIFCLTLSGLLPFTAVFAETVDIEPEADKIFKQMGIYLSGLKKFEVTAQSTIETILDSGQKIMLDHDNTISVKRPNKFFSSRQGDLVEQKFYYDGDSFTLYGKKSNYYASVDAPNTLSKALDYAIQQFGLTAPGADLLHENVYERLSHGLLSGFYVGKAMINGVECHHLAFRNTDVDWQIWVQTGDIPLPKRYVITSKWITGSPHYSVTMSWNLKPNFTDGIFNFVPPKNAEKIELIAISPSS